MSDIDELGDAGSELSDEIITIVIERQELIAEGAYSGRLQELQATAVEQYSRCQRFRDIAENGHSRIVAEQLPILYKLEKFLKHVFRQLVVADGLGFSERLLMQYLATGETGFCYAFVRNACSTLEVLGKWLEGRAGEGNLDFGSEEISFPTVYNTINEQDIQTNFLEKESVLIPPNDDQMPIGDVSLDGAEIGWLWDRRTRIVHDRPLVVDEDTLSAVPAELRSTAILSESAVERLIQLASRTHLHSTGMLLSYSMTYQKELVGALVEAWYPEDEES